MKNKVHTHKPSPIENTRARPMYNLDSVPPPTNTEARVLADGFSIKCSVCGVAIQDGERYIRAFTHQPPPDKGLVLRMHYNCSSSDRYPHRDHRLIGLARLNCEIESGITSDKRLKKP